MGYPLEKILASLPAGPRPPIFIGVAEPLCDCVVSSCCLTLNLAYHRACVRWIVQTFSFLHCELYVTQV